MNMPFVDGRQMTIKANQKVFDDHLEKLYVSLYPHLQNENFMNFTQFKEKVTGKSKRGSSHEVTYSGKSDEQIIAEAENILSSMTFEKVDMKKIPKG